MPTARQNISSWNLESFLDSLVVELDKAQDTLAIKGVNRPLTYSVKELALDLEIFPEFDGDQVRFKTAKPGETGSSKMSFQLGSITSEQIRRTTREPVGEHDISIDEIEEIDEDTKSSLRKYGIKSGEDLDRLQEKKVDLDEIVSYKKKRKQKNSYADLANIINKAKRRKRAPSVSGVSLTKNADDTVLAVQGMHLSVALDQKEFPVAMIDGESLPVVKANDRELLIKVDPGRFAKSSQELQIALDPYAVLRMNLKPRGEGSNELPVPPQ